MGRFIQTELLKILEEEELYWHKSSNKKGYWETLRWEWWNGGIADF